MNSSRSRLLLKNALKAASTFDKNKSVNGFLDENSNIDYIKNAKIRRIIPLIYKNFITLNPKHNSLTAYSSFLKETHRLSVISQTLKIQLLKQIIDAFTPHDISIILLKGVAFNYHIYPVAFPRLCSDIDILIKYKDRKKAKEILSKFLTLSIPNKPAKFDNLYEDSFYPMNPNLPHVDVHYCIVHPTLFNIDERILWQDSKPHPFFDVQAIRVLSPEHNLIHLALHSLKDISFFNYSLLDAAELIHQQSADVQRAFSQAKAWNASYACYFLLSCYDKVFDTSVIQSLPAKEQPSYFRRKLGEGLIVLSENTEFPEKGVKHRLFQLMSQLIMTNSLKLTIQHFLKFLRA